MKYLAPNDEHQVTVPVIVGAEYAIPTGDAKLAVRLNGSTDRSTVQVQDSTDITFNLTTPDVPAGEVRYLNVEVSAPTNIGSFYQRMVFGVVDTLDIPTDGDAVRSLLGVTFEELPNENIDLEGRYVEVYKWLINDFHTLRQNDPYLTKKFGDLIALISAIYVAPTLIISLDKSRKTENGQVQRIIENKYFQDFLDKLDDNLASLKEDLADFLEVPEAVSVAVLEFAQARQWSING